MTTVKLLMMALMLNISTSFAGDLKSYNFVDAGKVQISELEREISPGFRYAHVKINSIRRTLNPFQRLGFLIGSEYRNHIIKMTLNDKDKVKCRIIEIMDDKKFMITDCFSGSSPIYYSGFIRYEEVGSKNRF